MKPLEIGKTATLENGDVVKCVKDIDGILGCDMCCFYKDLMCTINLYNLKFFCLGTKRRPDRTDVHFELVEKIPQSVEEIRKE